MNTALLAIIITCVMVILLILEVFPAGVTALAACCALALLGCAKPTAVFSGFSDSSTLMLFGMLVIGTAMTSTGVLSFLSRSLLRLVKGKVKFLLPLYLLMMFLVSGFLVNTSTFAIFIPLFMGIVFSQTDRERYSGQRFAFFACAVVYKGGLLSLAGTGPNMASAGIVEKLTGNAFSMFEFAPFAFLFLIIGILYFKFVATPLSKKIRLRNGDSQFARDNAVAINNLGEDERLSPKGIICICIFALMILGLLTESLHGLSKSLICMTGVILCLLTRCITLDELCKKLPFPLLLFFGAILGFSEGFCESGADVLITDWLMKMFSGHLNPLGILFLFSLFVVILVQFMSSAALMGILIPMAYSIAQAQGFSFLPLAVGITVSASIVPIVPFGSPSAALAMDWGNYRFKDYCMLVMPLAALELLAVMIAVPIMYPF